jgi:siroheme synthase (precorrin-2 oxidase/ferrochelatase)
MNTFHTVLHRSIISFLILCFMIVATYVPQSWNQIKQAEAGAAGGGATVWEQLVQIGIQLKDLAVSVAEKAYSAITSFASSYLQLKESTLDGIAWVLAKKLISMMTASIVDWINTGFKGSPSFVQDLGGFLTDVGDKAFGEYIKQLGGPLSFLCSPFQLDVRIALSLKYVKLRSNDQTSCTLTGALANMEDFIDGSFGDDGFGSEDWDTWFKISSNPTSYTALGSLIQAETDASIKITNSKGEQKSLLDFGQGFFSSKVCTKVENKEHCYVSTPGNVISEALNFQLSSGGRSLIAADEINEIIGALLGQISQKALTGAKGLLGLSKNTGYTEPGYDSGSFMGDLDAENTTKMDPVKFRAQVDQALTTEVKYRTAALKYEPLLSSYAVNILDNKAADRDAAQAAANDIDPALLSSIDTNIVFLSDILADYDALPPPAADTNASKALRNDIIDRYLNYLQNLHTEAQVTISVAEWDSILGQ